MSPVVFGGLIPGALIAATCETLGATVPLVGHLQGMFTRMWLGKCSSRSCGGIQSPENGFMEPKYFAFRR